MSFVALVGVGLILTVGGLLFLYQSNSIEAPAENPKPSYTEFTLEQQLDESDKKMSQVIDDYYNGKYNEKNQILEASKIIENEVDFQKQLFFEYKDLPHEMQTNLKIAQKFYEIERNWFAFEESIIGSMNQQVVE